MNSQQMAAFDTLCQDSNVCVANAYFFVRDGEGHPEIDWMCRKDLADNGTCWCGRLTAQFDGDER